MTREEVEDLVSRPVQVVPGDLGTLVAQAPREEGLLRAVFVEEADERRIVTVYWTSRVGRYWRQEEAGS